MKSITSFYAILFVIASLRLSSAAITPVNLYHLGDLDSGASNGMATAVSADYIGSNAVTCVGIPAYSTDVPPDYPLPDTYSMNFTGTNYGVASVLTNATDNFGIQAWVKVRSTGGNRCIAYNGSGGTNGWGLFLVGDTFQGSFGNVGFIGSAPVQTNVWTHLALVRDSGVATLYANGVACGTNSASPIAPSGAWTLGASPLSAGGEYFDGLMDEVQVFTFAAGTFSTTNLAYRSPDSRKLSAALNGTNFLINWPGMRSDMQLQYTTNLASGVWTTMTYSTNNSQYTAADTPGDSPRFYRLMKPAFNTNQFVVPRIDWIRRLVSTGVTATNLQKIKLYYDVGDIDFHAVAVLTLSSGAAELTFDASSVVNPRTGTAEAINYHWLITYPTIDKYTDAGIHGYRRSILNIDQNALIAITGGGNFYVMVTLTVSDKLNPDDFREVLFVATVNSILTLGQFTSCQTPGATVCGDPDICDCNVPAALPAADPNDPP